MRCVVIASIALLKRSVGESKTVFLRGWAEMRPRDRTKPDLEDIRKSNFGGREGSPPALLMLTFKIAKLFDGSSEFALDVLECPRCGGRMRIPAAIEDPSVARKILDSLGLRSRPPPGHFHGVSLRWNEYHSRIIGRKPCCQPPERISR